MLIDEAGRTTPGFCFWYLRKSTLIERSCESAAADDGCVLSRASFFSRQNSRRRSGGSTVNYSAFRSISMNAVCMRSSAGAKGPGSVAPEASLWPPPPNCSATSATL